MFTDVLEHVVDDVRFLASYVTEAPENAKFVITVPAFMALWSGHDVFLKHFRRYRKIELEKVAKSSGLIILESRYLFVPLFPVAWLIRKLPRSKRSRSQLRSHGRFVNFTISQLLKMDGFLSKILPFGVSIIILGQKAPE